MVKSIVATSVVIDRIGLAILIEVNDVVKDSTTVFKIDKENSDKEITVKIRNKDIINVVYYSVNMNIKDYYQTVVKDQSYIVIYNDNKTTPLKEKAIPY